MKRWMTMLLMLALAGVAPRAIHADSVPPTTAAQQEQTRLARETAAAIDLFKKTHPELAKRFESAAGYVVFPSVAKGAAGIGAAHGEGEVYANGKKIGTAALTQVTLGIQLGGQVFSEVIFFDDKATLDAFARSVFSLAAQATAVAAADGAAATAKYNENVEVHTVVKGGLMFEASLGGQKFSFAPLKDVPLY
jgi:lipid-binding SYLF domain-containing protein